MIQCGSVYLLRGMETTPHFHVVVFTHPNDKRIIACYLSSSSANKDNTTVFEPGDDFFISKNCWVKYSNARILSELDCNSEIFRYIGIANEETVIKIRDGFRKSLSKVRRDVKALYSDWREEALFNGETDW